jgi:hypothetical protein
MWSHILLFLDNISAELGMWNEGIQEQHHEIQVNIIIEPQTVDGLFVHIQFILYFI